MPPLSRVVRRAAAAFAVAILAGCASMIVRWDAARGFEPAQYHTYAWDVTASQSTGDPRLDDNRFFHERVQASIEAQLGALGYERMQSGRADLLVHYHVSISQRIDVARTDQRYGSGEDLAPTAYDAGTLLIDIVDTRTGKVVWRGWAEDTVDGVIEDQQRMEQKIDEAVTRILRGLRRAPPRPTT